MIYFDEITKEYLHRCNNDYNGCGDDIWEIGEKELCTDCAIDYVINLDKAEQFLFRPRDSRWKDIEQLQNVLTYVLTDDEIYDALMKAYKEKKDGIAGHLECLNGLEECIRENADEKEFLKSLGYKMIQEEY